MKKYYYLKLVLVLPLLLPAITSVYLYFDDNILKNTPYFISFYLEMAPFYWVQYVIFEIIFIIKFPTLKYKKIHFSLIPIYFSLFNLSLITIVSIIIWNSSFFVFVGIMVSSASLAYGYLYIIPLTIGYYSYEKSILKKSNKQVKIAR